MESLAREELRSEVFWERMVRTRASRTEGEAPQPAEVDEALGVVVGRERAPWREERMERAREHSWAVGWGKLGKGEVLVKE
jgi:hypothetical protein